VVPGDLQRLAGERGFDGVRAAGARTALEQQDSQDAEAGGDDPEATVQTPIAIFSDKPSPTHDARLNRSDHGTPHMSRNE